MPSDPLASFNPQVRDWFTRSFERPTAAQAQAWPAIARGENVLVSAPTGSGKTLAAFLWALDRLVPSPARGRAAHAARLRVAAEGALVRHRAEPARAAEGDRRRRRRSAIRTGDTPQSERQAMLRTPPDVLITTPESLYLMLTSRAREILAGAECGDRRRDPRRGAHQARRAPGAHARAARARWPAGRSSGSACRPRSGRSRRSAASSSAPAASAPSSTPGVRKPLDLKIHVPVEDMREPDAHDVTDPAVGGMGTAAGGGDLVGAGLGDAPGPAHRALDLAGDLPRAARAGQRAPLDDRLREQPPRGRAAGACG